MPFVPFTGWGDEDDDFFSILGWTNYPDDGPIDGPIELVSDLVVSIQVVEEIASVLGDGVFQSPSQEEYLHNDLLPKLSD